MDRLKLLLRNELLEKVNENVTPSVIKYQRPPPSQHTSTHTSVITSKLKFPTLGQENGIQKKKNESNIVQQISNTEIHQQEIENKINIERDIVAVQEKNKLIKRKKDFDESNGK